MYAKFPVYSLLDFTEFHVTLLYSRSLTGLRRECDGSTDLLSGCPASLKCPCQAEGRMARSVNMMLYEGAFLFC